MSRFSPGECTFYTFFFFKKTKQTTTTKRMHDFTKRFSVVQPPAKLHPEDMEKMVVKYY